MARYWAKLDNNRIVTEIVVADEELILSGRFGLPQNFVETSYTGEFRKNYAGIGYTYDIVRNAFITGKPFASWILNEDTCQWDAPIAYPTDGGIYIWDEETLSWVTPE
jgi:hypothetical protein